MAAPKPTPTVLKLLKGTPGKKALNKNEPMPERGLPPCPDHIEGTAKEAWDKLCKSLDDMGVLTVADGYALEILCGVYSRIRTLNEQIKKDGLVIDTVNVNGARMMRGNPAVSQLEKAESLFKNYLTEFGLTPSSRSKISVNKKEEGDDPLSRYNV